MVIGVLLASVSAVFAQGTTMEFGQNRVQYKHFEWSFFESDHFTTYFYLGGQDIGKYSIIYSEAILEEVQTLLEFKLTHKIEVIVYNDLSDLNQTNIGIGLDLNNTGGLTKIIENKLFVYFDGNHAHLEKQIRQGIAQIMINHMLFGTSFQEVLQNAVLLNLPPWFSDGLASYIGENWSSEKEERLRDGILSGRFEKLARLNEEEAKFVGHAFWHYVELKYGKSAVANLLYLTRINRSMESGFMFVLGGSVQTVMDEWYNSLYSEYTEGLEKRNMPGEAFQVPKKKWKKRHHYQPVMSDDGKYVAFVTNVMGEYKVYVVEVATGKRQRILKGGHKTITLVTDYSYPQLAWSPDRKTLAVIYNKRDKLKLMLYDADTKEKDKREMPKFQQVHDFSFADPNMLVMSAVQGGQTDIFTYLLPNTTTEQITNDYYDDLYPAMIEVQGRKGIIFSSNRKHDTLREERLDTTLLDNTFDLFFYNMRERSLLLDKLTFTDDVNEIMPQQYNDSLYAFISDRNGIRNRYTGYFRTITIGYDTTVFFPDSIVTNPEWSLDSMRAAADNGIDSVKVNPVRRNIGVTFPNSDYGRGILAHDISPYNMSTLEMFREDGRFTFYISPLREDAGKDNAPELFNTPYREYQLKIQEKERKKAAAKKQKEAEKAAAEAQARDSILADSTREPVDSAVVVEEETSYFFQNRWNTSPDLVVPEPEPGASGSGTLTANNGAGARNQTQADASVFKVTQVLPYRVKFSTDYILTQIDNSLIMTRYEVFRPGVPVFNNPALSGMINLGISDLFEDHKVTGGFRFPFNFQGSEYFLAYENLKKRIDKKFMYYRRVDAQSFDPSETLPFVGTSAPSSYPANLAVEAKVKTNYFETRFSYPLDVINSFRLYFAYRHESYVYQSMESFTLNLPTFNENWLFAKLEFVHDKTIRTGTNLFNGLRFKFWAEIHKQFTIEDRQLSETIDIPLPSFDNRYFAVFGADIRHYQKIHRNLIWANRFAMGTSVGTRKLMFYLGGVDSWINPQFNQRIPINENNNYAFQTIVTNMRGFDQNIRNGHSYAVLNSEVRWPIFDYFIKKPIRSAFVRDFQLIGFTDIGTAWEGVNPYDEDNPLFIDTIAQDPVTIKVEYFRNPIVVGYGFGLRTSLFGYYLRFDVAWAYDSGDKLGPRFYFSLTTDF